LTLTLYGYNLMLSTLGLGLASLHHHGKRARSEACFWEGRFAHYQPVSPRVVQGRPRIWLHAASVGEVTGAMATVHTLRRRYPRAALRLTTGTPTGFAFARQHLGDVAEILPFPLDFPWVLHRALQHLQPDLYVALESEFWPNLFWFLRRNKTPALLLNGRLSERSARNYALLRPLYEPVLRQFHWLAMHSAADRNRAIALGAVPERTLVLGSAKYDCLLARASAKPTARWRELLRLDKATAVLIGGSLRGAECTTLLQVFASLHQDHPQLLGIFVPRHLEQLPTMQKWLQARQIPFQLLSNLVDQQELRFAPVVLVDRMGVLFELYALGHLIFCGGTLEPIGGHNILEPAAWGKPVFYGPPIDKVAQEHHCLSAVGAGFMVADAQSLAEPWKRWIQEPPQLMVHGAAAPQAIQRLGGVAEQQVELIASVLQGAPPKPECLP
jgi:3-deoxy-D-manno-octulosonic-acid transferase